MIVCLRTYLLSMNASPRTNATQQPSLTAAERIARRNLDRARALGDVREVARAARRLSDATRIAAALAGSSERAYVLESACAGERALGVARCES